MQIDQNLIDRYLALIRKWNISINLISKKDIDNIYERHFINCLDIAHHLPKNYDVNIADIGSGGGFPGVIIALLGYKNVTLIESDIKKSVFLQEAKRELGLSYQIKNCRIEDLSEQFEIITARALADIEKLIVYCHKMIEPQGYLLFLKGKDIEREIKSAQENWQFDYEIFANHHGNKYNSIIEGYFIKITNIAKK